MLCSSPVFFLPWAVLLLFLMNQLLAGIFLCLRHFECLIPCEMIWKTQAVPLQKKLRIQMTQGIKQSANPHFPKADFLFTLLIFSCMYYRSFSNSCSISHLCPWGQESTGGQTDQDTYGRRWMSESAIECPGLCSCLKAGKYKPLPLHRSAEQNKNWVGRDTSGSSHLKQNEQVDEREQQEQWYLFSLLAGVSGALLLYYQLQVQLNPINIGFLMWSRSLFSDVGHGDISKLTAICRAAERTKDGWEIQCRMFMVLQNLLSKVRIYPHTRNL